MARFNNNSQLNEYLTTERILQSTNPLNQINRPIINEIFDTSPNVTDNRIFINNKPNLLRFPITPPQMIDGVEVDVGFQEALCKKVFADAMTNFISSEKSFNDRNQINIARFQFLINKTFTTAINNYRTTLRNTTHPAILENDILFIYKGGTTMKLIFDKYKILFRSLETFSELEKFFTRSDSDYSILINPSLHNFSEIYKQVNKISTCCLLFIKKQIISNPDFFVPLSTINPNDIRSKIDEMNSKLQEMKNEPDDTPYCNKIRNIDTIIGMSYFNQNIFNEQIPALNNTNVDNTFSNVGLDSQKIEEFIRNTHVDTTRNDFYMTYVNSIQEKVLSTLTVPKNDIYLSLNETNEYFQGASPLTAAGVGEVVTAADINETTNATNNVNKTAFCLHRLKINFVTYYKNLPDANGVVKYGYFSTPSELVDVSIVKSDSKDLKTIYKNIDHEFSKYSNVFNGTSPADELIITFKSYSIYGHISDLCTVLFVQGERPWKTAKYDKRRNRLLCFLILEIISIEENALILNIMNRLNLIINDALSLNTLQDEPLRNTYNKLINIDLPELITIIELYQTETNRRDPDAADKHFAIIKFLNYYLELLTKVQASDNEDLTNFINFNRNMNEFINRIMPRIITMRQIENRQFDQLKKSNDETINLTHLGGNINYREKYLKYKAKYLNLKNA
jgi:hypothetical protein